MNLLSDDEFLGEPASGGSTLLNDDQFMGGATAPAKPAERSAAPTGDFKGLLEPGNVDLAKRPVVKNEDGSVSTVRSMSFEEDGKEILIPTVSPDGKLLDDKAAIDLYHKTGQHLGKFDNPDDATAYAQALHGAQADFYSGKPASDLMSDDEFMGGGSAPASGGGFIDQIKKGFISGLVDQNPQMVGNAMEAIAELSEPSGAAHAGDIVGRMVPTEPGGKIRPMEETPQTLRNLADQVKAWGAQGAETRQPNVPSVTSIRTDSLSNMISDAADYAGYLIGSGAGTSAPSLAAGVAGAAVTKSPLGFIASAAGPSYVQNLGDTYGALLENEGVKKAIADGKITRKQVASIAAEAAIPMAALDAASLEGVVGLNATGLKQNIVKRLMQRVVTGALTEGATEGVQQVIQEAAIDVAGGDKTLAQQAVSVIDNAIGGALAGGTMSAGASPAAGHQAHEAAPPIAEQGIPQGAASADTLFGQESAGGPPPPSADTAAGGPPPPPAATIDVEKDRPNSPRLTPEDRASPLPNDLIDDGKKIFDEALGAGKKQAATEPAAEIPPLGHPAAPPASAEPVAGPAVAEAAPAPPVQPGMVRVYHSGSVGEGDSGRWVSTNQKYASDYRSDLPLHYLDIPANDPRINNADIPEQGVKQGFTFNFELKPDEAARLRVMPRANPASALLPDHAFLTTGQTNPEPTPGQAEAGNYAKRKVQVHGLDVSIENEKGGTRRSKPGAAEPWEVTMPAHYGYIRRTSGADGDQVDTYLGDHHSDKVYVIDQIDAGTKAFDEHKVMMDFPSREAAVQAYEQAFSDGKGAQRIGAVTEMPMFGFKSWLKNGDTTQPLSYTGPTSPSVNQVPETAVPGQPPSAPAPVDVRQRNAPIQKGPRDIIQFLAQQGGVQDFKGELRAIDAHKTFVPGVGKLMREKGVPLDTAREAAAEMGYFDHLYGDRATATEKSTVADLLDLIAETRRGNRQYVAGEQGTGAAPQEVDRQQQEIEALAKVHGLQLTESLTSEILDRMASGMAADEAIVDVLERESLAIEHETEDMNGQGEQALDEEIPFDAGPAVATGEKPSDQGRDRQGSVEGSAREAAPQREQSGSAEPDGSGPKGEVAPSFLQGFNAEGRAAFDAIQPANRDIAIRLGRKIDEMRAAGDTERADRLQTKLDSIIDSIMPATAPDGGAKPQGPIRANGRMVTPEVARRAMKILDEGFEWDDAVAEAIHRAAGGKPNTAPDYSAKHESIVAEWGKKLPDGYTFRKDGEEVGLIDPNGTRIAYGAADATVLKYLVDKANDAAAKSKPAEKPDPKQPTVEAGAEGKPQSVIPGAEKISQGQQAQREADKPLRAKAPQKDAGELFDRQARSERQDELFSLRKDITDTPAFKRWFGDSEVVDENGDPLVVYHGTRSDFDEFSRIDGGNAYGEGFYFTRDPAQASDYATGENVNRVTLSGNAGPNVMPVYLSAKKLFPARGIISPADLAAIEKATNEKHPGYFKKGELASIFDHAYKANGDNVLYQLPGAEGVDIIRAAGFDGMDTQYGFVVFDPTQIKSVNNQGAFDANNPNIRLKVADKELRPTDAFTAQAQDVGKRLRAELDRLGLKDIGLRISENLGLMVEGKMHAADGSYFRKLISVSLDAENPDAVLDHEAIHALRDVGAFTKDEWAILDRKSRKEWVDKYEIADTYGQFPEWVHVEEGIAHAYADWRAGRSMDGIIAKAFKKIRGVLQAIGRAFGKDFRSVEDVFSQVASGEIGNRRGDVAANPVGAGGQPLFQSAWHGTPHDFDSFSTEHIGTGEGNQAFGWGLYFAGKKEIAEHYRKGLSHKQIVSDFREALPDDGDFSDVMDLVGTGHFTPYQDRVLKALNADDWLGFDYPSQAISAAYRHLDDHDPSQELRDAIASSGKLFKVDLPEDSELLNWDKPLSEQPSGVREKLDALGVDLNQVASDMFDGSADDLAGRDLYQWLQGEQDGGFGSDRAASQALRNAGIPGLKYLDGSSRGKGEGSHNYVIFDDSRINVEERFKLRSEPKTAEDRQKTMQGMIARGQPIDRALRLPFQFFGGVNEKGQWKPGLYLSDKAAKIITTAKIDPEGRFGWMAGPVEAARAGLIDRYGLSPEYIERDRQRHMDERAITMRGAEVLKTLAEQNVGPNEARVLQAILTGEAVSDKDMQGLAAPIRQAIDELGQEAVSLGLISAESFERNRGSYLHRVYMKHESEQNNLQKLVSQAMGSKRKKIIGDTLKGRGIFWEVGRDQLLRHSSSAQAMRKADSQIGGIEKRIDDMKSRRDVLEGEMEALGREMAAHLGRRMDVADRATIKKMVGESRTTKPSSFQKGQVLEQAVALNRLRDRIEQRMAAMDKIDGEIAAAQQRIDQLSDHLISQSENLAVTKGSKFVVLDKTVDKGDGKPSVAQRVYLPADEQIPARFSGPEWTNRGTWEARQIGKSKVTLWRDYSQAERTKMGEILDARYTIGKTYLHMAHDLATGRFYKDIAANEDWASSSEPAAKWVEADQHKRLVNDREVAWVKVPDTTIADTGGKKRWGALSGKWVRSEIWRDLNEIDIMNRPSTWRMLLKQWKQNKALALDTPIPTPSGWTTMGDIKAGDQLFDERGQVCVVEEVKEIQYGRPCYEVGFSDGSKIVADDEHWWFVVGRNNTKGKVLTTAEIRATLKEKTRGDCNHSIPVAGALDLPAADLPLPPYALGMWLGDGNASGPRMTVGGAEIDEVERELAQVGVHVGKRCQDKRSTAVSFAISTKPIRLGRAPNPFKEGLKALGVLDAKHVPAAYLRAGVAQRMALLQGLMDSDGWITERGTCGFATSSRAILQGAMELMRSLGYKPAVSEKTSLGRPSWRILFQAYADAPVFRLQKKLRRMRQRPAARQRSSTRQIVSITPVPSVPVRCIAVSSPSHLYLAGEGMVPTHNTSRNPVTHMNNVMSNLLLMDMQDVRVQDLQAGLRSFISKDKHWQDANEHGVFGADMMSQEIRDNVLKPILEEIEKQGQDGVQNSFLARAGILGKFADRLWSGAKTVDSKMTDLYRAEDDVFRLASYRAGIARGETPEHAAAAAREQFLDYDIHAPWVNAAGNSLLPFISYTYRAVPLIARTLATRPWKLAKYAMVAYALNALAYAWDDKDEEEKERASLRDEEQGYTWLGTPRMMRMPFRNGDGLPVFLDVRRWIPGGDVFDTNQGSSAVPVPAPLQFGGPLMLAFELALNKSSFTGDSITNDLTDNWFDKSSKVGDYLWKAWMPSAAWVPNSWYWTKIENAAKGATDAKGRPYSLPEAVASSFGVKVKPQDVETGIFWHYKDMKDVETALRAEARTLARQRDRGLISQKAFDAGMQALLDKRDRLVERVKELQGATRKK